MEGEDQDFWHSFSGKRTPHSFSLRQRTHHFVCSAPSWLEKNPQDTTSFMENAKFQKKYRMRFIDLEVAPGYVWVYTP